MKKGAALEGQLPERLPIPGLDPKRIGPLCVDSGSACPLPTVHKPLD